MDHDAAALDAQLILETSLPKYKAIRQQWPKRIFVVKDRESLHGSDGKPSDQTQMGNSKSMKPLNKAMSNEEEMQRLQKDSSAANFLPSNQGQLYVEQNLHPAS